MADPQRCRRQSDGAVVEAMHLTMDVNPTTAAAWCGGTVVPHPEKVYTGGPLVVQIPTAKGVELAGLGDWIVKGAEGFCPCTPSTFAASYGPADV